MNLSVAKSSRPDLRPKSWLSATGWRGVVLGLYCPESQAVVDGDGDERNQADGDDRMHDQHEPMPGGRVRALDVALDQDAVFVLFADDFGHRGDFGVMESAGPKVWRSPESSGMQKANPGGLAKCKKFK